MSGRIIQETPTSDPFLFQLVVVNDPQHRHGVARVWDRLLDGRYIVSYLDGGQRAAVEPEFLNPLDNASTV